MDDNSNHGDGPFDKSVFDNLKYLSGVEDQQMFERLIALFEVQLRSSLEKMNTARAASDNQNVSTAAHALKGSSGNVGATRLAELCGRLEDAVRGQADVMIDDCLSKIEIEVEIIQATLAAELTPE